MLGRLGDVDSVVGVPLCGSAILGFRKKVQLIPTTFWRVLERRPSFGAETSRSSSSSRWPGLRMGRG
jgi:hypothetical protein